MEQTITDSSAAIIQCGEKLTIYQVADLREKLLPKIADCDDIQIDLCQLKDLDVAGMQLLISISKTVLHNGKTIMLVNVPDLFNKMVQFLGISLVYPKMEK